MRFGAIFPTSARSAAEQNLNVQIADMAAQLSALRAIVDDLNVGIVLLDRENQVLFINRAFRRFWRIPDEMIENGLTFVRLMYHGRGTKAYTVPHHQLGAYVAQQMSLVRAGEEGPLQIRFADGSVIQFRCKVLPNGGRLLTYGNVSELVHQADVLERLASVDGMTGLNNRRHFLLLAETEWSRFQRYGRPLALLMIDIDLFKSVNDKYGHDVGNAVIKAVAGVLQKNKRASDIAGRLGGEEFALLLPEATLDSAASAADRLRQLVADRVVTSKKDRVSVTISVGVSVCNSGTNGIEELLKQADIALYEAKHSGRNCVCRFDPSKSTQAAAAGAQAP